MTRHSKPALAIAACVLGLLALTAATTKSSQGEEQAIRDLGKKWLEAATAKNADAVAGFYATDASFLAPGAPIARGREAIRAAWAGLLQTPGLSLTFAPTTIRVARSGDMAYEIGAYDMSQDGPAGKVQEHGKFVIVWTRLGGEWKAAADIFNSDPPAAAAPAAK